MTEYCSNAHVEGSLALCGGPPLSLKAVETLQVGLSRARGAERMIGGE